MVPETLNPKIRPQDLYKNEHHLPTSCNVLPSPSLSLTELAGFRAGMIFAKCEHYETVLCLEPCPCLSRSGMAILYCHSFWQVATINTQMKGG